MIALSDAERALLTDLAAREKKNRGTDAELDQKSENLYQSLYELWQLEMLCKAITPTCCEAAQTHPAILFDVVSSHNVPREDPGRWYLAIHSKETQARATVRSGGWIARPWAEAEPPPPKFCPYCAAALPAMRLKNPLPENIRDCRGEDWCETCDGHLADCLCDPPSSVFELIPAISNEKS
jgi:hypothetical protein